MFTRIFKAAAAALLLVGCAATLISPTQVALTVNRVDLVVAAPPGLCIDPTTVDVTRAGAFLLITDCALTRPDDTTPIRLNGVLSASVSTGGLPGTLKGLEDFLTGPGIVTIGKSGEFDKIKVLAKRRTDDILFLKIEDTGEAPIPGTSDRFWRAFFEIRGRLVGGSLVGFEATPLSDAQSRSILGQFAAATRAANAPPASAEGS